MKKKGTKNLTYTQRLIIESCLKAKLSKKEIAEKIGCHLSTIYNELKRGATVKRVSRYDMWGEKYYKEISIYSPEIAEEKYRLNQTSHGRPIKLGNDYEFCYYVEKRIIEDRLSACAVIGEINKNNMFKTRISKTTLYRYIELGYFLNLTYSDLPFAVKKKKYRKPVPKRAPKGVSIEKRPLEVFERKTFGHWEMDCVLSKRKTKETLLCLTERLTRFEIIYCMPNHKAETVVKYLNKIERKFGSLFRKIFKSITVDNGAEFSDFTGLEKSIFGGKRTALFYCHPYTSCERGSNERLNRDVRRLLPKKSDFSKYDSNYFEYVSKWVNNYPRAIFGFSTAYERFNEELSKIAVG